jgi:hypothetical protein
MLKGKTKKEAAKFKTYGLSLENTSSLLPVGRYAAQRLASPVLTVPSSLPL